MSDELAELRKISKILILANAKAMEDKNCALVLEDNEHLANNINKQVNEWLGNPEKLLFLKKCLANEAQPHAGDQIVREIKKMLRNI